MDEHETLKEEAMAHNEMVRGLNDSKDEDGEVEIPVDMPPKGFTNIFPR
tara:strand:+ start:410 stop:556 length:147 start_codon:yes stop_codon:yes gene_type:complete